MAVDYNTNKKVVKKEVSYLGRDFSSVRQNLIEFAKTYFPTQYNDFNESSPGMMFVEMASYVGDVLNYYVDNQYRETLLNYAEEKKNVYNIAQSYGYKPKTAVPASVELEVTQTVPAKSTDGGATYFADLDYAGVVSTNGIVSSDSGVDFTLLDQVDFRVSSSLDPMSVEVVQPSSGNIPTEFLLKKRVLAKSGTTTEQTFTFTSAKKFDKVTLGNTGVTEIVSITDSNSNTWYEVPFLAQDTVFESIENTSLNDPTYSQYQNDTPYMLRLIKSSRRFITRVTEDDRTEVRFGAGISDNPDEVIVPNPDNVGSALGFGVSKLDESFDPSNFMKTKTYGLAPSNTTLTIKYRYGGAVEHNVRANSITSGKNITFTIDSGNLDSTKVQTAEDSLSFNNVLPATGGASKETLTEIKQNALAYLNTQNRAVTRQDYITRVYSLPQKFGNIAKTFIVQDEQNETNTEGETNIIPNPLAMNMYLLGYDDNRKLTSINDAVKQNLKMYLSQYRILTDAINLKNAYVVNVGVKFAIITQRGYNKSEVLFNCVQAVKKHFDVSKWQINQPIVLSDIAYEISLVEGVASVVPPKDNNPDKQLIVITNKATTSSGYSGNVYDIESATRDGVIYPSLDPSIFEVKYPNQDILGKVVGDI
jgi:hypothetical protein|tara:strand:+ start:20 stop:1960 length:1941 start_codon:yes stop_codon:yes gene_type:complete